MARDDGVAAHAARLVAHAAYSHRFAGRACVQAGGIRRARHGAYALEALINVFDDLIHANEHNNVLRAKREACHAVGVAVDVHELAFERKRIGAHEEEIGIEVLQIDGSLLFGRGCVRAVEHGLGARFEHFLHAGFLEGLGAAPRDARALRYKGLY